MIQTQAVPKFCAGCLFLATDNAWCAKLKRNVSGERCMHYKPREARK